MQLYVLLAGCNYRFQVTVFTVQFHKPFHVGYNGRVCYEQTNLLEACLQTVKFVKQTLCCSHYFLFTLFTNATGPPS